MKVRYIILLLIFLVFIFVVGSDSSAGAAEKMVGKGRLRVYLPREVVVKDEVIDLGSVGLIRGDEDMVATAKGINMGRFSLAGQEIVIDKPTVLSRLVSNGISRRKINISGAERVIVKRDEKTIGIEKFIEAAKVFVNLQLADKNLSKIEVLSGGKSWVVPDESGEIKLTARMSNSSTANRMKVWVGVIQDGVETGGQEIALGLTYKCRQAIALCDIPVGGLLSDDNITVEAGESDRPEPDGWAVPYGMTAKRAIKEGQVITEKMMDVMEAPVLVERKQTVVLKIERPGLLITSLGTALTDGKAGDAIRVRVENISGQSRIVVGKVRADGTLEPVY